MDLEEKTASGDYKYPQHFSRACVDRSGESMHLAEEALKAEKYTSGVDCVRGDHRMKRNKPHLELLM